MKLNKILLLLICVFTGFSAYSQKSAMFKGKLYRVYPQTIDHRGSNVYFNLNQLQFNNLNLPPIIGSVEDGEYLIYNTNFLLKNKRKIAKVYVYDTVYQVYATFTIKDNKKEGNASIYEMYTQELKCVIPYKNDLIHGHFVVYQSNNVGYRNDWEDGYYRDNEVTEALDCTPYIDLVKFNGSKYELTYSNGILNGNVKAYKCNKKDTLLIDDYMIEQGVKNGPYKHFSYYKSKKQIKIYCTSEGMLLNGEKEGKWTISELRWNDKQVIYYNKGAECVKEVYYDNVIVYKYIYGRDSVIKHFPDYKSIAIFPDVEVDRYGDPYSGSYQSTAMIRYDYKNGVLMDKTFCIDDWIKPNFYKRQGLFADTIINGRFFRTQRKDHWTGVVSQFLLDTCGDTYNQFANSNGYCAEVLVQTTYSRKGKILNVWKSSKYYELHPEETNPMNYNKPRESHKALITKKYYKPLDYGYKDVQWIKGRGLNSSIVHKVSGDKENGSIVKLIKIPMKYDTLVLVDTIMKGGKFMYKQDEYFKAGFESYLQEDEYNDDYELNNFILEFFKVVPQQHKAILLGKEQFTGDLKVEIDYKRNPKKLNAQLFEIIEFFGLQKRLEVVIKLEQEKDVLRSNKYKMMRPSGVVNYSVVDGAFNGSVRCIDIFGYFSVSSSYYDNKLNDDLEIRTYSMNKRWNAKMKEKNFCSISPSMMTYSFGQKEGQWFIAPMSNAAMKSQYIFHNNKLNGMQYRFSDISSFQFVNYVYPMENDTINGDFWHMHKNGYPIAHGHFNKGVPHGEMVKYFNSYDRYLDTAKYFREKYTFDHGYLSGRYSNYRDTDNLRLTIDFDKKDSMYFTAFRPILKLSEFRNRNNKNQSKIYSYHNEAYYDGEHGRSYSGESNTTSSSYSVVNASNFVEQLFESPYLKRGLYTYYYKSGYVFKQGYKINHELSGRWTFFREGKNRVYKTIDFKDSFLYADGEDSVFSKGLVKAYYDDGKPMFIGYATDNDTKYTCESETEIPTEEDYYLAFYDTLGQNILKDGSGFVTELQASGHKLKEGQIVNYKKNGIWVYYNNYGQAEAIGMYENGLRVGRWLFGDLSGLNLSDKVCFMNNDEYMDWINTYGGNLDLTESFFNKGKLLNSNSVETIKR
jgi:hypothetical protein